ncbi:MAG TPA: hypothetical protein PKW80_06705 [Bacteroidales bacterium]|nr:hypothetical protein [Bacteroidales bacterium]
MKFFFMDSDGEGKPRRHGSAAADTEKHEDVFSVVLLTIDYWSSVISHQSLTIDY